MRTVDLLLSFPSILVAMMILAFLGKGVGNVVLTLVILEWAYYARTARARRWWKAGANTWKPRAARVSRTGASWSGTSCPTACRR